MDKKTVMLKKDTEAVTNCDYLEMVPVEHRIITLRGYQVILDKDLAELYGVETRSLNQAVSRNIERFPSEFRFQINKDEMTILKSHFVTSRWGGTRKLPFAFTEQGVAISSQMLKFFSALTILIRSCWIMNGALRKFLQSLKRTSLSVREYSLTARLSMPIPLYAKSSGQQRQELF